MTAARCSRSVAGSRTKALSRWAEWSMLFLYFRGLFSKLEVPARMAARSLPSVSQCLPSLQSVLDAFLRLLLAAQRLEGLAFQVEQILFAEGSSGRDFSA